MLTLLDIKHLIHNRPLWTIQRRRRRNKRLHPIHTHNGKKLEKYQNKITLYKETSIQAVTHFDDNLLDFIYIDGDHTYKSVSKELELYYPKVKSRGVMGGHDFFSRFSKCNPSSFRLYKKTTPETTD